MGRFDYGNNGPTGPNRPNPLDEESKPEELPSLRAFVKKESPETTSLTFIRPPNSSRRREFFRYTVDHSDPQNHKISSILSGSGQHGSLDEDDVQNRNKANFGLSFVFGMPQPKDGESAETSTEGTRETVGPEALREYEEFSRKLHTSNNPNEDLGAELPGLFDIRDHALTLIHMQQAGRNPEALALRKVISRGMHDALAKHFGAPLPDQFKPVSSRYNRDHS